MNRRHALLLALAAAAAGPALSSGKEPSPMSKTPPGSSRPAPPRVDAIEYQGVRYEQDTEAARHGGDQPGGYLVAIDPASGARLWMLKVYTVPEPGRAGLPRLGRYFKRMTLVPEHNELEIENEVGGIYRVDLAARTSKWISGPDSRPN
jgi:hypothetical protein